MKVLFQTERSTVNRIFEIHEKNALNESGEKVVVIKQERVIKKTKLK